MSSFGTGLWPGGLGVSRGALGPMQANPYHGLDYKHTSSSGLVPAQAQGPTDAEMIEQFFGRPRFPIQSDPNDSRDVEHEDLPQAYDGPNYFVKKILIAMITEADLFPIVHMFPLKRQEQAMTVAWDRWIFNDHNLGRVPEESVPRLLSSNQTRFQEHFVRYGLALMLEHGFYKTPKGRQSYMMNLQQIRNATVETLAYGAVHAAINHPPHKDRNDVWRQNSGRTRNDLDAIFHEEIDNWAIIQKTTHGMHIVKDKLSKTIRDRCNFSSDGSDSSRDANLVVVPEGCLKYLPYRPENSVYMLNGLSGGPNDKFAKAATYFDGKRVFESRGFRGSDHQPAEDPCYRPQTIGGYSHMTGRHLKDIDAKDFRTAMMNVVIYSATKDDYHLLIYEDIARYTGLYEWDVRGMPITAIGRGYFQSLGVSSWGGLANKNGVLNYLAESISSYTNQSDQCKDAESEKKGREFKHYFVTPKIKAEFIDRLKGEFNAVSKGKSGPKLQEALDEWVKRVGLPPQSSITVDSIIPRVKDVPIGDNSNDNNEKNKQSTDNRKRQNNPPSSSSSYPNVRRSNMNAEAEVLDEILDNVPESSGANRLHVLSDQPYSQVGVDSSAGNSKYNTAINLLNQRVSRSDSMYSTCTRWIGYMSRLDQRLASKLSKSGVSVSSSNSDWNNFSGKISLLDAFINYLKSGSGRVDLNEFIMRYAQVFLSRDGLDSFVTIFDDSKKVNGFGAQDKYKELTPFELVLYKNLLVKNSFSFVNQDELERANKQSPQMQLYGNGSSDATRKNRVAYRILPLENKHGSSVCVQEAYNAAAYALTYNHVVLFCYSPDQFNYIESRIHSNPSEAILSFQSNEDFVHGILSTKHVAMAQISFTLSLLYSVMSNLVRVVQSAFPHQAGLGYFQADGLKTLAFVANRAYQVDASQYAGFVSDLKGKTGITLTMQYPFESFAKSGLELISFVCDNYIDVQSIVSGSQLSQEQTSVKNKASLLLNDAYVEAVNLSRGFSVNNIPNVPETQVGSDSVDGDDELAALVRHTRVIAPGKLKVLSQTDLTHYTKLLKQTVKSYADSVQTEDHKKLVLDVLTESENVQDIRAFFLNLYCALSITMPTNTDHYWKIAVLAFFKLTGLGSDSPYSDWYSVKAEKVNHFAVLRRIFMSSDPSLDITFASIVLNPPYRPTEATVTDGVKSISTYVDAIVEDMDKTKQAFDGFYRTIGIYNGSANGFVNEDGEDDFIQYDSNTTLYQVLMKEAGRARAWLIERYSDGGDMRKGLAGLEKIANVKRDIKNVYTGRSPILSTLKKADEIFIDAIVGKFSQDVENLKDENLKDKIQSVENQTFESFNKFNKQGEDGKMGFNDALCERLWWNMFLSKQDVIRILDNCSLNSGTFWRWCMVNDVKMPPIGLLLARPHKQYEAATLIYMKGYGASGYTWHGHADFQLADDAARKMMYGNFTLYAKTVVMNPEWIALFRNLYIRKYIRGNGHCIWDPLDSTHRDEYTLADPHTFRDIFVLPIPILFDMEERWYMDITGRFHPSLAVHPDVNKYTEYPGAHIYSKLWGWEHSGTYDNKVANNEARFNTLCFQEFMIRYGSRMGVSPAHKPTSGITMQQFENYTIDRGHWGKTVYPGCGAVIRGGVMHFRDVNYDDTRGSVLINV